jgi:ubiquinone/menaquinone biosynthesis C-methylase UbiE
MENDLLEYLRFTYNPNDPVTASVFDECSLWAARFGCLLLNNLELRSNLKILDLACGMGFPLFELAQMYGVSCQVTGVDSWKAAIERAKAKLSIYRLPNVRILEADATHLPFQDETFDMMVSNLGINNFTDPNAVVAECFRIAKPQGRLVLTTNPVGHMDEFYEVFRATLREVKKSLYLERLERNVEHRGTKEMLFDLFHRNGFRIQKIKEDQFQLRYLNGSALFNHALTKFGFLDGWRQVVDPVDEEWIFAILEQKLNNIAKMHGQLRLTVPMLYLEGEKIP